ncbi:hypothetical protein Bbelb_273340 [Branchiostoma belcheri]|nr:hypothetical protein Bbelb_273340 [Branchiostoma belcheri]
MCSGSLHPPDSGERMGFFMTILLALVVFLQVLSDSLPKTSTTTPQLGQFFAATIALVGFSCLASIVEFEAIQQKDAPSLSLDLSVREIARYSGNTRPKPVRRKRKKRTRTSGRWRLWCWTGL